MDKPLSIGVVGYGYWGPNLVRNFKTVPNCRVPVVCDVSASRLKHLQTVYPEIAAETDFSRFLQEYALDAVLVATPVRHHYSMAKASLLAGKHTFIEKPMATTVAECEELIELAAARGLTLMVGHTFLYSPPVRKVVEIIRQGDIGDIRYINCRRLNLGLFQTDINVAWDLAPHDLAIILHILGELPTTINCQGHAHVTPGIEDITNMSLSFASGQFATIQSSWLEPRKVREMTIVGTRRMIVYDDLRTIEKVRIYDTRVERPPFYDSFAQFQYSYHYGDSYIPHVPQEEPLKGLAHHFVECIQTGRRPLTSGRDGLDMVRILEAATTSLKSNGAPVGLPPLSPRGTAEPRPALLGSLG